MRANCNHRLQPQGNPYSHWCASTWHPYMSNQLTTQKWIPFPCICNCCGGQSLWFNLIQIGSIFSMCGWNQMMCLNDCAILLPQWYRLICGIMSSKIHDQFINNNRSLWIEVLPEKKMNPQIIAKSYSLRYGWIQNDNQLDYGYRLFSTCFNIN